MEWQNCPFWQTVFAGPQAQASLAGCSALQDIAGDMGLATCRPLASAKPPDMAIARQAIAKVFSIVSSSQIMRGMDSRWSARTCGRGQKPEVRTMQITAGGILPTASFAMGYSFTKYGPGKVAISKICFLVTAFIQPPIYIGSLPL